MTTEQDQTPKDNPRHCGGPDECLECYEHSKELEELGSKDNPSILDRAEKLATLCREFSKRIEKTQALLAEKEESAKANKAKLDAVADDALELIGQTLSEEEGPQ